MLLLLTFIFLLLRLFLHLVTSFPTLSIPFSHPTFLLSLYSLTLYYYFFYSSISFLSFPIPFVCFSDFFCCSTQPFHSSSSHSYPLSPSSIHFISDPLIHSPIPFIPFASPPIDFPPPIPSTYSISFNLPSIFSSLPIPIIRLSLLQFLFSLLFPFPPSNLSSTGLRQRFG